MILVRCSLLRASVALLFLLSLSLSACAPGTGLLAGGNWQLSGLQHQHIRVLEVDFDNTQTLYAGDTQQGVFVSTDSGEHWTQRSIGLPLPIAINALSFETTGKKFYAATDNGIFVSADASRHWQAVDNMGSDLPTDNYTALAFDSNAPQTIYTGTAHHGVYISTNDGASWFAANTGLPTDDAVNSLTFDSIQHQLWAATDQGIYRTDDRGVTWRAFNNGLQTNVIVNTVQVAGLSGGAQGLVFAGTSHGIYRSQDSGAHWMSSEESLFGTSIHTILIDFRSATTIYSGTDIGALRSDDNGQDWREIGAGLPRGKPVFALKLGASDYSQLYAAADDVYRYPGSSGGLSFTHLLPILLVLVFFYLLYRITLRARNRRRQELKPERIIGSPPTSQSPPSS
jgi:ligand-binding sensor domain-containing protein